MSFLDDAFKGIKKVVRSPVTKVVAGGLALAFPAVGVPAVAGLAIASKTLDHVDPKVKKATAAAAIKHAANAKALAERAQKASGAERNKLISQARSAQTSAKALGRKVKRIDRARSQLAKKLVVTRQAAKAGDKGAARALATFSLAKQAKAGNPKALAQAKVLRERHDVGQAIRKHFHMRSDGRVLFVGRAQARVGVDYPAIIGAPVLGGNRFVGKPPAWVRDPAIWARADRAVAPHAHRYREPWAVTAQVYKRMGGRVA